MERYSRHRGLMTDAQWERLCRVRVVVAGAGGLGSHVLDMLARLAPMQIEIWDPAHLDAPDLNRQVLYTGADVGMFKVEAARRRLGMINPDARTEIRAEAVSAHSPLGDLIGGIDVCFDCLDSFAARADLETALMGSAGRFTVRGGIVIFHGGVSGYFGQAAMLTPPDLGYARLFGPDFSKIPAAAKPVMPFCVAMVAATQVAQFMQWIVGGSIPPRDARLVAVNGLSGVSEIIEIQNPLPDRNTQ
jgi:molybdopterin/thiamine biosynthesis adenylyltransferase